MKLLRRFDAGLARGEAAIAAIVLLFLILIAATQALLRNLTLIHVSWANAALEHLSWGDSFMQKATLWLAFLGASLATHNEKHIAIDVLARVAPKRARTLVAALVGVFAAITCFYLARVFFSAVMNNAGDIPFDMQVMDESGASQHVCDAAAAALADASLERPGFFCGVRSALAGLGAHVSTPDTALQLIAPAMFLVMSVRFLFHSAVAGLGFAGYGPPEGAAAVVGDAVAGDDAGDAAAGDDAGDAGDDDAGDDAADEDEVDDADDEPRGEGEG